MSYSYLILIMVTCFPFGFIDSLFDGSILPGYFFFSCFFCSIFFSLLLCYYENQISRFRFTSWRLTESCINLVARITCFPVKMKLKDLQSHWETAKFETSRTMGIPFYWCVKLKYKLSVLIILLESSLDAITIFIMRVFKYI